MVDKNRTDEFAEGKRRLEEMSSKLCDLFGKPKADAKTSSVGGAGSGFFSGLGNLVEQLGRLAEQAEQAGGTLHKHGELDLGPGPHGQGAKGVYGFTVRTAQGDKGGVKVEPFGNLKRDEAGKLVEVRQIREPMIDVFDEADHLLIVAEVPGITEEAVRLELQDDILILSAEKGENRYRKEVLLPASFSAGQMSFTCHNGLLEVRFTK